MIWRRYAVTQFVDEITWPPFWVCPPRQFIKILARKALARGQKSHKMWSLMHAVETYFPGREGLKVMDCGAWDGWFLSYETSAIAQRIAASAPSVPAQGVEPWSIRGGDQRGSIAA